MSSANEGISVTKKKKKKKNEHSIESVSAQKHLGITIDKNMTWEQQIDLVCRNVSRQLTLTKLLSKYVNQNSLKQYYNSYVLLVFDFGCVVWRNTTNALIRLVRLQKRTARMILKADFITPSEQLFQELNWLQFPKRVQYHICLMVYKYYQTSSRIYSISAMLTYVSEHHERQIRSTALDQITFSLL